MPKSKLVITIDGPAGAGKTTISRSLADRLRYRYVDTGALYRAVAYAVKRLGVSPADDAALEALCSRLDLKFVPTASGQRLLIGEEDITDRIRSPEITMLASAVSARPAVRSYLLAVQREMGRQKGVVFEGRDMGTVVFPDADLKFFLDANIEIRAHRRYLQQRAVASQRPEEVEKEMRRRDRNDSTRDLAPLKPAADAIVIDSTELSIEEVINSMLAHIHGDEKASG